MRRIVIVGGRSNATNRALRAAFRSAGVTALALTGRQLQAAHLLGRLDDAVLLGRIDVSRRLDGVGETFWELRHLEQEGLPVLNGSRMLLRCHDKLQTARRLRRAGLPHPQTVVLRTADAVPPFAGPYVVKPRFGSWGRDVERCEDARELGGCLRRVTRRRWFRAHGAVVQEYVPNDRVDLRVVVAAGHVVGAIERVAAEGEWRTNISLGGVRRTVEPPAAAATLACLAAAAFEADLVGVDLLPGHDGSYSVIELNGAVEFTDTYGEQIFARVADLLVPRLGPAQPQRRLGFPLAPAPPSAALETSGGAALV
jgi:RimK family alpha-L-glutamate ligase